MQIQLTLLLSCLTALPLSAAILDLTGHATNPLQTSHHKPVVLVFLRTDCPISNRYAPTIQQLAQKYFPEAKFYLVYPGKSQTAASIRQQLKEYGYQLPAIRDADHELVDLSQIKVTPEAAVFTASQELLYHGRIDNLYEDFGRARAKATTHELDDAVSAALHGTAPAIAAADAVGCSVVDLE